MSWLAGLEFWFEICCVNGVMTRTCHRRDWVTTAVALFVAWASAHPTSAQPSVNWGFTPPTHVNLNASAPTNGQVQISFNDNSGLPYVIESSPDLVTWTPITTNTGWSPFPPNRQVTVDASESVEYFRAWRSSWPLLRWAVAANGNISMNGNGLATDSFDSSDTNKSTNGQYDPSKTGSNGSLASVNGVIDLGSHFIQGDLDLGPGASYASSTNQISGSINYLAPVIIPDASLPNRTWWPAPTTNGVHDFTSANTFLMNTFTINDSVPIQVQAGVQVALRVETTNFSTASITILGGSTNSGTLVIYQLLGTATIWTANFAAGTRPANFWYFGLPGVTNLILAGTYPTIGVLYAPQAQVTVNGGGGAPGVVGTLVAGSIFLNGHYAFHFDESLVSAGPQL
jgi:hypothetical protein